jgi:hypothetical protein
MGETLKSEGEELSQDGRASLTGFDSASRQPPPFEGKAWELSPLGMIRSPCLFYRARVNQPSRSNDRVKRHDLL